MSTITTKQDSCFTVEGDKLSEESFKEKTQYLTNKENSSNTICTPNGNKQKQLVLLALEINEGNDRAVARPKI